MRRRSSNLPPWTRGQRRFRYGSRKAILGAIVLLFAGGLMTADRMGFFGGGRPFRGGRPHRGAVDDDRATFDGRSFVVTRVSDGDTLDVHVPGDHPYDQRVRLLGVDTPETVKPNTPVQYFGREASAFTKRTVLGQTVTLELDLSRQTRDKYDRVLAYVVLPDGRNFCRVLIEEGYGYADPRFVHPLQAEFAKAQKQARKDGRGLWKNVKQDDLPFYFRETLRLPKR